MLKTINTQLKKLFGVNVEPLPHPSVSPKRPPDIEIPPLLKRGEYSDVITIRNQQQIFHKVTNVPYVMGTLMDKGGGYEWGYGGTGPTDFALNILMHFTDHDEAVARAFHIEFRDKFLLNMPLEGGRITKDEIFALIENMKAKYPEQLEGVKLELERRERSQSVYRRQRAIDLI